MVAVRKNITPASVFAPFCISDSVKPLPTVLRADTNKRAMRVHSKVEVSSARRNLSEARTDPCIENGQPDRWLRRSRYVGG